MATPTAEKLAACQGQIYAVSVLPLVLGGGLAASQLAHVQGYRYPAGDAAVTPTGSAADYIITVQRRTR